MSYAKENWESFLAGRQSLQLAVEGTQTNLEVWVGHDGNGPFPIDTIFMRLDRTNNYNVPLSEKAYSYLNRSHKDVLYLVENFGFKSSIDRQEELLRVLEKFKYRQLGNW